MKFLSQFKTEKIFMASINHLRRVAKGFSILWLVTAAIGQPEGQPESPQNSSGTPGRPPLRNDFRPQDGPQDRSPQNTPLTNKVSITLEGNSRVIHANGIPDHQTGQFPGRNNPNRIAAQNYSFRVPVHPQAAAQPTRLGMYPFGVALNGVVFDPGAAEWWDNDPSSGWQFEPLFMNGKLGADESNGHVQPTGAYHYHGIPNGLVKKLGAGKNKMTQLAWAADGFPIYGPLAYTDAKNTNSALQKMKSSYRIKSGTRPDGPGGNYDGRFLADWEFVKGAGDLDECNGRFGVTPEFPQGTFYYVLTEDWPFIPRVFKGAPDSSFFRKGPPGGFGGRGGPGRGRGGPGGFRPPGPPRDNSGNQNGRPGGGPPQ